ncbi:MAG: thermonuclease family protein [Rhizobium sp.]|nr:thermonuclease family protein [Rhizobium sp.]
MRRLIPLLLFWSISASAATLVGQVVGVTDGDTVTVLDEQKQQHKVRLAGIDAPEKKQPFGQRSKEALSDAVFGKTVSVEWNKLDRYGRIIGKIVVDARDVNLSQVEVGLAWWYQQYSAEQSVGDRQLYALTEENARRERLGLWSEAEPTPPWDWRKLKKASRK